jgi:hypothetical protein
MNIPSKIKVGGIIYKVKVVDPGDFDDKVGAQISTERCWIKVMRADPQFMKQAFWHELFHAMNMEMEEEKVEFLAQAIMQIMVDNPKLFEGGDATHGKPRKK